MTNTAIPDELAPCPFCGGEKPGLYKTEDGHTVECRFCFCCSPERDNPADAVAAWNRRATRAPDAAVLREAAAEAADLLRLYARVPAWAELADRIEAALRSSPEPDARVAEKDRVAEIYAIRTGAAPFPFDRDELGRQVRRAWIVWATAQPNPKPSWLVPYDDLAEADKEADRQIGLWLTNTVFDWLIARWDTSDHRTRLAIAFPANGEKESGDA